MNNLEAKIAGLESRLHRLSVSGEDNQGIRRKIEREIRDLKKKLEENQSREGK